MLTNDELTLIGFAAAIAVLAFSFFTQHFVLLAEQRLATKAYAGIAGLFAGVMMLTTAAANGTISLATFDVSGPLVAQVSFWLGVLAHWVGLATTVYALGQLVSRLEPPKRADATARAAKPIRTKQGGASSANSTR